MDPSSLPGASVTPAPYLRPPQIASEPPLLFNKWLLLFTGIAVIALVFLWVLQKGGFSSPPKTLVYLGEHPTVGLYQYSFDDQKVLSSQTEGSLLFSAVPQSSSVQSVAFSPSAQVLALATDDISTPEKTLTISAYSSRDDLTFVPAQGLEGAVSLAIASVGDIIAYSTRSFSPLEKAVRIQYATPGARGTQATTSVWMNVRVQSLRSTSADAEIFVAAGIPIGFSKDSSAIVVANTDRQPNNAFGIYTRGTDGVGKPVSGVSTGGRIAAPVLSGDGSYLAFVQGTSAVVGRLDYENSTFTETGRVAGESTTLVFDKDNNLLTYGPDLTLRSFSISAGAPRLLWSRETGDIGLRTLVGLSAR